MTDCTLTGTLSDSFNHTHTNAHINASNPEDIQTFGKAHQPNFLQGEANLNFTRLNIFTDTTSVQHNDKDIRGTSSAVAFANKTLKLDQQQKQKAVSLVLCSSSGLEACSFFAFNKQNNHLPKI